MCCVARDETIYRKWMSAMWVFPPVSHHKFSIRTENSLRFSLRCSLLKLFSLCAQHFLHFRNTTRRKEGNDVVGGETMSSFSLRYVDMRSFATDLISQATRRDFFPRNVEKFDDEKSVLLPIENQHLITFQWAQMSPSTFWKLIVICTETLTDSKQSTMTTAQQCEGKNLRRERVKNIIMERTQKGRKF